MSLHYNARKKTFFLIEAFPNDDVYGIADDVADVVVLQGGVAVQHCLA